MFSLLMLCTDLFCLQIQWFERITTNISIRKKHWLQMAFLTGDEKKQTSFKFLTEIQSRSLTVGVGTF